MHWVVIWWSLFRSACHECITRWDVNEATEQYNDLKAEDE